MKFISIDPGLKGAIVVWDDGVPLDYELMPVIGNELNFSRLMDIFRTAQAGGAATLILEKVGGLPNQSAAGGFNFGRQVGAIQALAWAAGLSVLEVRPQDWQKVSHAGLPKSMPPKDRSRAAAQRLYPQFQTIPKGCRVSHDGICDALLLGHWYARSSRVISVIPGDKKRKKKEEDFIL